MYWFNRQRTALLASMKTAPSVEPYLTFQSVNSFTISTTPKWNGTMQYSTDATNWSAWNGSELSSVNGKLYFRGTGNTGVSATPDSASAPWVIAGIAVECVGNIENLLDYATVSNGQHPTMANYCYSTMFFGCTALTTAPALPANTLVERCYSSMFSGCTALTTAPILPATTLANYCYIAMFNNCAALTTAPALPATTLANYCYRSMFNGCTNLKVSATQTGAYQYEWRIPTSGIGTTATSWNSDMLTNTGGTKTSNPSINTTYYVEHPPVA